MLGAIITILNTTVKEDGILWGDGGADLVWEVSQQEEWLTPAAGPIPPFSLPPSVGIKP